MTWTAVEDLLAQSLPTRVLLINQGASKDDRAWIDERIDHLGDHRVLGWQWNPPLPSLSAAWNRALAFVWELGGTEALVMNNDVHLHKDTYGVLDGVLGSTDALFVSAVGVTEAQFKYEAAYFDETLSHGGPDFSCFLLSKAGHEKYPFDEQFIPSYLEDLDAHRRYMLGGDGNRIFSINLPYLHYASGTLKAFSPEERQRFNKAYARNKEYYRAKWGGPENEERFVSPHGRNEPLGGAAYTATPDLQRRCLAGLHPYDDTQSAPGAEGDARTASPASAAAGSGEIVPEP